MKDDDPNIPIEKLETRLAELAPPPLPDDWREAILDTACAENVPPSGLKWLFPKPLVIGLAAAWALVLAVNLASRSGHDELEITMPDEPLPPLPPGYFESQQQHLAASFNHVEIYDQP